MLPRASRLVVLGLTAVLAAACGGQRSLELLDARSGATLVRGRVPLVFARSEPRYSRSARDYLYIGPVETNRQGVREHYLWVGVATTLDRGFLAPAADAPQLLYVEVGGEPMELVLKPWRAHAPAAAEPLYATDVPVRQELAARVTLQQLALLDAAPLVSIATAVDPGSTPRVYERWRDSASFAEFLERVAGAPAPSVQ